MNLLPLARACVVSAACLIFPAVRGMTASADNVLKVQVTASSGWQSIAGGAAEKAFAARVSSLFAQSGINIPATSVRPVEDVSKVPYLLTINLAERSINAKGGLDFAFTATLRTPEGQHDLGRFTSSVAEWLPANGKLDLGQPLADAAEAALRQVCTEVLTSELSRTPVTRLLL